MKKILVFRTSPELGDGDSSAICVTVDELVDSIRNWAANFRDIRDAGESFSVELIAMSDEEIQKLPHL